MNQYIYIVKKVSRETLIRCFTVRLKENNGNLNYYIDYYF